jgi:hypothetical protein
VVNRPVRKCRTAVGGSQPLPNASLHAPEVECIGEGKAHRSYEYGVKVSVATAMKHSAGEQFVIHAAALPDNPYDGHTLGTVIPQMQALIVGTPFNAIRTGLLVD